MLHFFSISYIFLSSLTLSHLFLSSHFLLTTKHTINAENLYSVALTFSYPCCFYYGR
ncbi:transmembrane protein, putative [Medicago truncatula]|uniref:Transmembrane protein, putative n=1 Tax=Medicago truncatula TaxID=3880 RepID=G7JJF4_MEDTR|nr:transmembrane protein, putative [Medicago truncatula]